MASFFFFFPTFFFGFILFYTFVGEKNGKLAKGMGQLALWEENLDVGLFLCCVVLCWSKVCVFLFCWDGLAMLEHGQVLRMSYV